jgi:predicted trehalose synthase
VAGILRSLDYAGAATGRPDRPDVRRWVATASRAFLAGYCQGPLSFEQRALLDAYLVDKVCYEVVYETRQRPTWAPIPLHALTAMAQAQPGSDLQ